MWKFISAGTGSESGGTGLEAGALLRSLNSHAGRQIWVFDENAGTKEERAKVEELRNTFTANRHTQHHSSDELLRLQCAKAMSKKAHSPPKGPVPDQPDAARVADHLKGGISFYECLQQARAAHAWLMSNGWGSPSMPSLTVPPS